MAEKLLRDVHLAERYGVTRVTIWRWRQSQPDFPAPLSLTPGTTRWRLSDIEKWEESRAAIAAE